MDEIYIDGVPLVEYITATEAEIAALRKLVGEMGNLLAIWNSAFPCSETYEILNRPEVKAILEESNG